MDMLKYERKYWQKGMKLVAGIDEAGRGPLAGPVVASVVIFKKNTIIEEIKDSKKLTEKKRKILYKEIFHKALDVGVGVVHEKEIDKINILQATYLAMKKSIGNLKLNPEIILIDGPRSNIKQYKVEHIIDGDNKSQSIAAASIVSKVFRDKMMYEYDKIFPEYFFSKNKGYGTKQHIESINNIKASPIHRKSFHIVKNNLPTFRDIEKSYGFNLLGIQIIASTFIKKGYQIADTNISKNNKLKIEICIIKDDFYKFIKIISTYKDENSYLDLKENYILLINEYLEEKDIKSEFEFVVISIKFSFNKKSIIKTIEIK